MPWYRDEASATPCCLVYIIIVNQDPSKPLLKYIIKDIREVYHHTEVSTSGIGCI